MLSAVDLEAIFYTPFGMLMAHYHMHQKNQEETRKLTDEYRKKQKMGKEDTTNKINCNFNRTVFGKWQSNSVR
jgi:hypothetical protein